MIDYAILLFLGAISTVTAAGSIFFAGFALLILFDRSTWHDVGDFVVALFISIFIFMIFSMSFSLTLDTYAQIQDEKDHPCIKWETHYDTGSLRKDCIARKP